MTNKRSRQRSSWTSEQLHVKLQEQVYFLLSSCASIDNGIHIEALRLASTLRTLLHHTLYRDGTAKSHALLEMINCRESITWVDKSIKGRDYFFNGIFDIQIEAVDTDGETHFFPLSSQDGLADIMIVDGVPTYVPAFRSPRITSRFCAFSVWWEMPFISTLDGTLLSRKDLVTHMANSDGGSHIDARGPQADYDYYKRSGHGLFWSNDPHAASEIDATMQKPSGDVISASLHHMAHEVVATLRAHNIVTEYPDPLTDLPTKL